MTDENDLGRALDEREKLGRAAYAAYVATGADTDGAGDWRELFRPMVSPSWETILRAEVEESIQTERDEIEAVLRLHATDELGNCAECTRLADLGGRTKTVFDDAFLRWPCSTAIAAGELRVTGWF